MTNAETLEEILLEREETKATFLPQSCWLDAFSDSTIISARAAVKSKFLRLGIRVYIQLDIVYRGRIRYKERERKGEGGKRRWCVKLTARLPVSRDYCSNSRARRVTVRTLGRYSLIHKRPRSLVSGFVREIVACYIPWLYTFLQSRPVVIAQRYFRRAKGKRMLPC